MGCCYELGGRRVRQDNLKMSRRAPLRLDCSLQVPAHTTKSQQPSTPNTPEILDTLVSIAAQVSGEGGSKVRQGLRRKVQQQVDHPQQERTPWTFWGGKTEVQDPTKEEERRRRRRERNKVAAEKCRMRKRERTTMLINEAEVLEAAHASLQAEAARLRNEAAALQAALSNHRETCRIPGFFQTRGEKLTESEAVTPRRTACQEVHGPHEEGKDQWWVTFGGGGWGGGGGGVCRKDGQGHPFGFMGEYVSNSDYGFHGNWSAGGEGYPQVSSNYSGSWSLMGSDTAHSPSGEELLTERQTVWPSSAFQWPQDQQRHGCLAAK